MKVIVSIVLLALIFGLSAEEFKVVHKEFPYVVTARGTSKALLSKPLMTPGEWLPFSFVVADGSYVKKGDIVASFDSTEAEYEYKSMQFAKQVVEQQLKYELTEIDNDRLYKNDKLEAVIDKLKISKAALKKMRELPLADEVLKAEGKLRIAKLQHDAALKEFEKAAIRFKKNFISKTELDQKAQDLKVEEAGIEYAAAFLKYQKLPARKSDLKIQEIKVAMAQQEVGELKYEISQLEPLQAFEKKTAKDKKKIIDKRLKQKKQDVENTIVKAPVSGYVKHFSGGRKLGPGAKYWSEFRFADIPDITSLVFEAQLPEEARKFYKLNDPVEIYVTGRKGRPVKGFISQIAGVPIDVGEKGTRKYGSKVKLTGIKIYIIQVKLDKYEDWMKPGMNADIKVMTGNDLKYPAVPVKYLKIKDGKNFLSINGVYQEITGFINQGWFMIESPDFKVSTVQLDGAFKNDKQKKDKPSGRFTVSGEVLPVKSTKVIVPDIYDEGKIYWLVEEESAVKKGDILIKMGTQTVDKIISSIETKKAVMLNTANTVQKKLSIKKNENQFKLKSEELELEISRIQMEVVNNVVDEKPVINSRLQWLKAKISYEDAVSSLQRMKKKNPEFISKVEMEKAIRDEKRRKLQLESALLNYEDIKKGSKEVQKMYAALVYHSKKVDFENYANEQKYEEHSDLKKLKENRLNLKEVEVELKERLQLKENLVIKAPSDGIIRYEKVWDNGLIDKISIGTGLRERMTAMTIPNLSSLFVKVEIPEKYYRQIKEGQKVEVRIPAIGEQAYVGKVETVEYIFKTVVRQDSQLGLYSSQEPLGQTVFVANVLLDLKGQKIKPGVIADVYFPFRRY